MVEYGIGIEESGLVGCCVRFTIRPRTATISFATWIAIYPTDPTKETAQQAAYLMGNANAAKVGIIMGYGGLIAMFIGLLNVSRSMQMAGGAGSAYAGITAVLSVSVAAILLAAAGLELGVTEATTAAGGETVMGVALALFGAGPLAIGIALILLGVGIALAKNFHNIAAAIAVVAGAILVISQFVDSDPLEAVAFVGFGLTAIVLGGLKLRSSD